MYQYPYQINSSFSKNQKKKITTTFGIEARFSLEDGKIDGTEEASINPLEYHAGYSRFTVVMIRKDENTNKKAVVTANIPAKDDADHIIARTRAAINFLVMKEMFSAPAASAPQTQQTSSQSDSLAYKTVLTMGTGLKGKTPAQVLLEDGKNKEKLQAQIEYLKTKLKDYPKNQVQIDACLEAIALFDAGKLSAANSQTEAAGADEKAIAIYDANFKPLKSTLADDGRVLVYSIAIRCVPGRNYPFEVTVKNSRCKWDGSEAHPAQDDPREEITMYMSEEKWSGIVGDMERQLAAFATYNYGKQSKKAEESYRINRVKVCEDKSHTA